MKRKIIEAFETIRSCNMLLKDLLTQYVIFIFKKNDRNVTKTAAELRVTENTIRYHLRKLGGKS